MFSVHDVFISYRRLEKDGRDQGTRIAEAIYSYLKSKGLRVFLDKERMENGPFPDQLRWQISHAPNYIFIATEGAMRFQKVSPPDTDYVAEEVRLALRLFEENPGDRVILPVIPQDAAPPADSDASYPEEIHRLFKHNAPRQLSAALPSEENLKEILAKVTAVNRGNLWNAGYRWLEEARGENRRFVNLNVDQAIMPLAGEERPQETHFPVRVHSQDAEDAPLMDRIRDTKGHLYLIGEGGIGKTTALFSIMERAYSPGPDQTEAEWNRRSGQVPLFIELSKAPDTYGRLYEGGKSTFIQRAVYQQLRTDLKVKQVSRASLEDVQEVFNLDPETAVKPIHDLFTQMEPAPEYLLLLDGLNEVSRTEIGYSVKDGDGRERPGKSAVVTMVLEEIKELMTDCPNLRVILTSRSKEETAWSEKTTLLYLSGVKEKTVEEYLRKRRLPESRIAAAMKNEKLLRVLQIPLFLTLYASLTGEDELLTRGEILHLFFHQKKQKLYTAKARSEAVDGDVALSSSSRQPDRLTPDLQCFILDFILPEIAWRMARDGVFSLQRQGKGGREGLRRIILRTLTDRSDTAVCGKNGMDAFTEYRQIDGRSSTRKTAKMLCQRLGGGEQDEDDAREEIVGGVLDCAVLTLGILRRGDSAGREEYSFIHQHIRDYFAAAHQINSLRLAVFLQENEDGETARQCLKDWETHPLHAEVRRFLGEALGEAHNAPVCDGQGRWQYAVPAAPCERNLIRRAFDIYRGRFGGENGYGVWNLMEILKNVRGDLAGEDFSSLDLTGCETSGFPLAHDGCTARLDGARAGDDFFLPKGHALTIYSVRFSSDGRRAVTASEDSTARLWDVETLQEIGTLKHHSDVVDTAVFSPDGRRILTASWDGTLKVWDANTLREIGTLTNWKTGYDPAAEYGFLHRRILISACFSLDGRRVAAAFTDMTSGYGPDGNLALPCVNDAPKVWDGDTLREIGALDGHTFSVSSICYSPDGRRILTASLDRTAKVWNAETLRENGTLNGHTGPVNAAAFSPDGRRILTASSDHTAKLWDAETLLETGSLEGHTDGVKTAVFSPDGRRAVTVSHDQTAKLWDTDTLREIGVFGGHLGFTSVCFSPDGRRVLTSSMDTTANVWDAETLKEIATLRGHVHSVRSARYSPDGRLIITTSNHETANVWDANTFQRIGALNGNTAASRAADYSPDGKRIVTSSNDGAIYLWDANTHRTIRTAKGHTAKIYGVSFSPDGRRLFTASEDGIAKAWDAETLREIGAITGHESRVVAAVCSPDGKRVITADWLGAAKVWDAETLREIGELKNEEVSGIYSVCFSPDGKWIATGYYYGIAKIWDAEYLCEVGLMREHLGWVTSVCFSPDGERVYTASRDKTVKVWDPNRRWMNPKSVWPIQTLEGHRSVVNCVSCRPDGKHVVTASSDGTAKIWDAETFRELGTLTGHTDRMLCAKYSPDSRFILTSSNDGTAKIWDAETFSCLDTLYSVPGLHIRGLDLRFLRPDSRLSGETKKRLYQYGALVDGWG